MKEMGNKAFQESDPTASPRATAIYRVIYRVINGEPQIVFVCDGCEDINVITVPDAMRDALSHYARAHRERRHPQTPNPQTGKRK